MVQSNISVTHRAGTVRGLHFFRSPAREYKLITCLSGSVWDIALDLREDSPSRHVVFSIELTAGDDVSLLLPPGVAHGFQALEAATTMLYQHSEPYRVELDAGVNALDPALGLAWPLPVAFRSERDASLPSLGELKDFPRRTDATS